MSMWTEYVWDPAKNFLARVISSTAATAPQKSAAQTALDTLNKVGTDAGTATAALLNGQSPAAAASPIVADLETGANTVIENYANALVAGIPVVGPLLEPEAAALIQAGLAYGEQHLHDLIAGQFAQKSADIVANTKPATAPQ